MFVYAYKDKVKSGYYRDLTQETGILNASVIELDHIYRILDSTFADCSDGDEVMTWQERTALLHRIEVLRRRVDKPTERDKRWGVRTGGFPKGVKRDSWEWRDYQHYQRATKSHRGLMASLENEEKELRKKKKGKTIYTMDLTGDAIDKKDKLTEDLIL